MLDTLDNQHEQQLANIVDLIKPRLDVDHDEDLDDLEVLVLEDDEFDYQLLRRLIKNEGLFTSNLHRAKNLAEARSIIHTKKIDVALVDHYLGAESGTLAIKEIGGRGGDFAVIMLSGAIDKNLPKVALNAGAVLHLDKNGLSADILANGIRSAVYTHKLEQRLKNTIREFYRANVAKTNFFSSISHDLKTPLNAIIGFSEALAEGHIDAQKDKTRAQDAHEAIHKASKHLLDIINHTIAHAADESECANDVFELLDLGEAAKSAIEISRPFAESVNCRLVVDVKSPRTMVLGNKSLLTQAVINLLTNAVKFSAKGSKVSVIVASSQEAHYVEVRDAGIGMAVEEVEIALKRYGRVELPSEMSREGSGFGLSIVQEVVEGHGGKFKLQSTVGRGTTARIILPKNSDEPNLSLRC